MVPPPYRGARSRHAVLRATGVECDQPALDLAALDEDPPSAGRAAQPEIRSQAVHVPGPATARVRSTKLDPIGETERDGRDHGVTVAYIGREGSIRRPRAAGHSRRPAMRRDPAARIRGVASRRGVPGRAPSRARGAVSYTH